MIDFGGGRNELKRNFIDSDPFEYSLLDCRSNSIVLLPVFIMN